METQTATHGLKTKIVKKYFVVIYGTRYKATSREDALKKVSKYQFTEFHNTYALEEVWEDGQLVDEIMVS